MPVKSIDRNVVREYYKLPKDKKIFVYGGNLGKPQAVNFIIKCLNANKNRKDCFFLIVGSGTEYQTIYQWINNTQPDNILLQNYLPNEQYNNLLTCCDVGMIFLDYRFSIPNYPSRLLSYLNNKLPVLIATDTNCDMGVIATENNFGSWCQVMM